MGEMLARGQGVEQDYEHGRELVREVPVASHVRSFASTLVMSTHPQWEGSPDITRRYLRYGASPRAAQALVLGGKLLALRSGRFAVSVDDIKSIALPSLRHRVIRNFEGEAEGIDEDRLIGEVMTYTEAAMHEGKEVFLR